jgi:hypothetical protein
VLVDRHGSAAHATLGLGWTPKVDENLYEVLAEPEGAGANLGEVIANASQNLDVARQADPVGLEQKLSAEGAAAHRAAGHRDRKLEKRYDFV